MGFFANLLIKSQLDKFNAFIWNTNKNNFDPIINIKTINLDLIIGIERQKKTLLENLEILLNEKDYRQKQVKIGMKRMGKSGASKKIVDYINLSLLT